MKISPIPISDTNNFAKKLILENQGAMTKTIPPKTAIAGPDITPVGLTLTILTYPPNKR